MSHIPPVAPAALPVFCRRDASGRVVALTREALTAQEARDAGWDPEPPSDAELNEFVLHASDQAHFLSRSDSSLARVLEDLIDVLINRGLIQFTDLPAAARAKLAERRESRSNLSTRLRLLPEEGDSGLI